MVCICAYVRRCGSAYLRESGGAIREREREERGRERAEGCGVRVQSQSQSLVMYLPANAGQRW